MVEIKKLEQELVISENLSGWSPQVLTLFLRKLFRKVGRAVKRVARGLRRLFF